MSFYTFPVEGGTVKSGFGSRPAPTSGASTNHQGIDIAVPTGTSVMSALSGVVAGGGFSSARGNYVTVNHGGGLTTTYQHLQKSLVGVGQKVSEGQVIALSGNSGISTGAHLHFELKKDGKAVDPMNYTIDSSFDGIMENLNADAFLDVVKKNWLVITVALVVIAVLR